MRIHGACKGHMVLRGCTWSRGPPLCRDALESVCPPGPVRDERDGVCLSRFTVPGTDWEEGWPSVTCSPCLRGPRESWPENRTVFWSTHQPCPSCPPGPGRRRARHTCGLKASLLLLCCREPDPLVAQRSPHVHSIQISPSEEEVRAAWAPRAPQPSSSTLRGRGLAQQLLGRWGAPCSVSCTHVEASHCLISCTLWSARPPSWGLLVPGLRPHRSPRL